MKSNFKVDFSKYSSFSEDSNFDSVVYGAGSPVLETELNELQQIKELKFRNLIKNIIGDGMYGDVEYVDGVLNIVNTFAIIDGRLIYIDNLTLSMSDGDVAYIDTWQEIVFGTDDIHKYGNMQSDVIQNKIIDSRYGVETTRRIQTQYNLVESANLRVDGVSLEIGTVSNNEFEPCYTRIRNLFELYEYIQSVIKLVEISANDYTDQKIADLINGAPTTLDTLKEIADAMAESQEVVDALDKAIGTKANANDLTSHTRDKSNPHGVTKSQVGLGNVGNFKAVSTVANQGLTDAEKSNARANIGAGTSSFSGSYNDLTNKPTIPTNNNQLTNGAGYITSLGTAKTISDTLPISKGGTGKTTGVDAANALINSLSTCYSTPIDADYYISQYSGGGTTYTTFHRRPMSALWEYIKSKLATVATSGNYNDLSNKPTIPTVGNGTVTIKQAGTSKGTFTMNQSGNTTIELTDNNTTYGVATSSALGLVKSGTDITVDSNGNVSVNDDSHNHVISNVDGLQSTLDGKLDKFTSGGIARCGGDGKYNYFKIATIKITSIFINSPVVFEMSGRGRGLSLVAIEFSSEDHTDPKLSFFTSNCDNCFWIKKTATSTWEVYGKYSELWGGYVLHRITGAGANIGVTVNMTNIDSLPSGCTQVAYGGNVGYAVSSTSAGNADTVNGHTVESDVPENAKFTDTTYDIVSTEKDGLMSKDDKSNLEDLLKSYTDNTLPTETDFNDVTTEGRYYMLDKNTYTNKPLLVNGFVDVKVYGQVVKQIIWRQGTIGTNDHDIYERTGWLANQNWSDWVKVLTTKDLTTTLTATTAGSPLDATVAKTLNDKVEAINSRLGTGNSSAYVNINSSWASVNSSSVEINNLYKVGKIVELDLALTFKVEQATGVRSQIGTISSGILPRCEISVPTNSFAPNAKNPNGTANAELRITTDGKVHWYNSTASSIPANGGMKAHAIWITK